MGKKFKAEYFKNKRDLVERAIRRAIMEDESLMYALDDGHCKIAALARIRDYEAYLRSRNMTS